MSKLILLVLWIGMIFSHSNMSAQTPNIGVSFIPQAGFLMPHRSTMGHLNVGHSFGGQIGAVIQTNGSKKWHHDFFFPRIEMSAFFYDLGNPEVLGQTFGVSSGMYLPYFKYKGWSFGSSLALGVGWVTECYDLIENPKNNVIGSHLNAMVNLGLRIEKLFLNNSIAFEMSMTHLSNGAYRLPNLGLNLPFLGLNYTYFLNGLNYSTEAKEEKEGLSLKNWSFNTQLIGSFKQIYPTGGSLYGVLALTNYAQYRIKEKCIIEGGVDAIYNQSIVNYADGEHNRLKNFQMGLYAAYVLPIHKIQFLVAMGRYIIDPLNPGGLWYHKFGGRFKITERLWGNFTIKSNWAKADYFEYGLSYRWK